METTMPRKCPTILGHGHLLCSCLPTLGRILLTAYSTSNSWGSSAELPSLQANRGFNTPHHRTLNTYLGKLKGSWGGSGLPQERSRCVGAVARLFRGQPIPLALLCQVLQLSD